MGRRVTWSVLTGERGAALVLALVAIVLLLTLAGALVMLVSTEVTIAASFRDGLDAFYTADGAIERAIAELAATPDWDLLVAGLPSAAEPPWRVWMGEVSARRLTVDVWIRDGPAPGLVMLQARAGGSHGVRRLVEATVARGGADVRLLAWREVR